MSSMTKSAMKLIGKQKMVWLVCLIAAIVLAVALFTLNASAAATVWEAQDQPALVLTGDGLVKNAFTDDADAQADVIKSLSAETAYSMAELKVMQQEQRIYSTLNNGAYRKQIITEGLDIAALLKPAGFDLAANGSVKITFHSGASFSRAFDAFGSQVRYRYPSQVAGSEAGAVQVAPLLAIKSAISGDNSDTVPAASAMVEESLTISMGQLNFNDINQSGFIKGIDKITVGNALDANKITILGKEYSRAELLLMPRVTATYEYITKRGEFTDTVRGISLAELTKGLSDSDTVIVSFADGYTPTNIKVADIRQDANRYMLATEIKTENGWEAIFNAKNGFGGPYALYNGLAGEMAASGPLSMIAGIAVKVLDLGDSPYKHITYQGTAQGGVYAVDAITGATLTVEGPGLTGTTPILVSDLEKAESTNMYRGLYTDKRNGTDTTLLYEGVNVLSIVDGLINSKIVKISDDVQIVFKNRWRQNVAVLTYADLKAAKTPVIIAYGTGTADGSKIAPFVYDDSVGIDSALGNNDGCLKLIFDKADFPDVDLLPEKFGSVAYFYVEPVGDAPGYKHSEATNDAFNNVINTQYLLTMTGSALGREVNYTVEQLEDMVAYDADGKPTADGLGYRADYSLSNTTYWYVNTYEGIKLWELLLANGLDAKAADDNNTMVWFSSWDNYRVNYRFSTKQLANPDLFYFYEKSPVDIGTDRPTKEELALAETQPDNQVGEWTTDANGYPIKKGYPVLLAYGLNGYPYVMRSDMDGFFGGLGNDGGPLRVIYGKADDLNKDNPNSIENYAYFFNNGSNQMQRAQEVFVGDEVRYSTHYQNPGQAYQSLANVANALTVEVVQQNGTKETKAFTLADLQKMLYEVDKRDMDNENRREKGYYFYKVSKVGPIQDIFEGVNLKYLLTEEIGMQGGLGSVTFYAGEASITMSLSDLFAEGYNSMNGTAGLGSMVAFAKNGYPLVSGSGSDGYVDTDDVTGITIKNSGGPLMFVRPQTEAEYKANTVGGDIILEGITKIVVNLEADKYSHTGDYEAYDSNTVAFTGAVNNNSVSLKISAIEKLQKYMITDEYTINGVTARYRGIDLQKLLADNSVGASALMSEIIVANAAGKSTTLTVSELLSGSNGKRIILAYGIGSPAAGATPADGKPLVPTAASAGYDAAYKNANGPLYLIIDGDNGAKCIENVTAIEVTASNISGWTHSSGFYLEYRDMPILRVTGSDIAEPKTFTVGDIEAMLNDTVFDTYKLGNEVWIQGVDVWKLIINAVGLAEGVTSPNITAYAADAYATPFKGSDMQNGVNGKPILVAYGIGTSQANGLPLVDGNDGTDVRPGYDPNVGNAFGPIRLMVNDNSGWCVKWLRCIVVGTGSFEDPADFPPEKAVVEPPVVEPPVITPPVQPSGKTYVVLLDDCLSDIAKRELGNAKRWQEIYDLNKDIIKNPHLIYPGQKLRMP